MQRVNLYVIINYKFNFERWKCWVDILSCILSAVEVLIESQVWKQSGIT